MNIPTPKLSTLGCRLNAYETEAMRELATSSGLNDAVIINTCAVTAEAVRKSKQEVRKLRKENPSAKVIVTYFLRVYTLTSLYVQLYMTIVHVDYVIYK